MVWFCTFVPPSRFFKESSDEEREHAEKLMEYQVSFGPLTLWSVPLCCLCYVLGGTDVTMGVFLCLSEQTWRQGDAPVDSDALNRV